MADAGLRWNLAKNESDLARQAKRDKRVTLSLNIVALAIPVAYGIIHPRLWWLQVICCGLFVSSLHIRWQSFHYLELLNRYSWDRISLDWERVDPWKPVRRILGIAFFIQIGLVLTGAMLLLSAIVRGVVWLFGS